MIGSKLIKLETLKIKWALWKIEWALWKIILRIENIGKCQKDKSLIIKIRKERRMKTKESQDERTK